MNYNRKDKLNQLIDISKNPYISIMKRQELCLSLNEKDNVSLCIWIGYNGTVAEDRKNSADSVWMRINCFQQYNVPFDMNFHYINHPVLELLKPYGFRCHIDNLEEILKITKNLKEVKLKEW